MADNLQNPSVRCVSSSKLPNCDKNNDVTVTVNRLVPQSIPNTGNTNVSFDTVTNNKGFFIGVLPVTSVTIPIPGLYLIVGNATLNASTTADIFFQLRLNVNGTGVGHQRSFNGGNTSNSFRVNCSVVVQLAQGDIIDMVVRQTDVGPLDLSIGINDLTITRLRHS